MKSPKANPRIKCLGNFCQLINPDCNNCNIDEALEDKSKGKFLNNNGR